VKASIEHDLFEMRFKVYSIYFNEREVSTNILPFYFFFLRPQDIMCLLQRPFSLMYVKINNMKVPRKPWPRRTVEDGSPWMMIEHV